MQLIVLLGATPEIYPAGRVLGIDADGAVGRGDALHSARSRLSACFPANYLKF
jgi:hypothetical protein